jgi:hypothetical protein
MVDIVNEVKYTLERPIMFGDKAIKEIIVSEPNYKVLKNCDLSDGQATINTIIKMCSNVPEDVLDGMSGGDYIELITKVAESDFLG